MSFFSLIPPEINSMLIYMGDGSSSLTAASAAWEALSEELHTTASAITNTISNLGSSYQGPSAAAMDASITPFATWLHGIAENAVQFAAQTTTQAGLYSTAYGAVIPPAVIAANRAELLVLVATNWLGQNSAAIATNEAIYQTYWAQDAAAMEAYSAGTQVNTAAAVDPAPSAQATSGPANSITSGLDSILNGLGIDPSQLTSFAQSIPGFQQISAVYNAVDALVDGQGGGAALNALSDLWGGTGGSQMVSYASSIGTVPARILPSLLMQLARMGSMGGMSSLASQTTGAASTGPTALMTQIGEFVDGKLHDAVGVLAGHFTTATNGISAKLAEAASMGQLRVPQGWAAAADGMVRAAPVLPHTTVSAPVQTMSATNALPGGPFGNAMMGAMAGRGMGAVAAKAPKIVPRSPSGG